MRMDIEHLLQFCVQQKASDLHLSAGVPPIMRIDGELRHMQSAALSDAQLEKMLCCVMNEAQQAYYAEHHDIDFALSISDLARFRVNVFQQLRGPAAVFRVIPNQLPDLDKLHAPTVFQSICQEPHGLVLVTGATGSGKSTTLAAMVDRINTSQARHILTIEDPIEFVHLSKKGLINQREVVRHTHNFATALRAALREDPDVILVGELRDPETIRAALSAAETGHLVLATLHTNTAAQSIHRLVDVFPAGEKSLVRNQVATALRAVVAQSLLPRPGGGRIAAFEIMRCTPAIQNLIREDKVAQIVSAMQTGQAHGMQTLEQARQHLAQQGLIALSGDPA